MSKKIVVLLFSVICLLQSCNTTEPPPPDEKLTLTLTLEDASSIEAWIKLTTTNLQLPTTVTLKRNNTVTQDIILSYADTVIYIDSLLPNQQYTFQAAIQPSSHTGEVKSNVISVTTMDTTSHNFTWQTWTFGEHSSSVLRDIAIIAPDNIWAVGEIYMNDSLGQPDPHAYNAVHWDGNEWKLLRIMFYSICGHQTRVPYPASAVFAFDENDVWIAMDGDQVARINGTTQVETHCMPVSFSIKKMWGSSSNNLYAVGSNGTIIWYNGAGWWRILSGIELNIYDIWGQQTKNGEYEILCVASTLSINQGKKVLQITGTNVKQINDVGLPWSLRTVWFITGRNYLIGGDGLYYAKHLGEDWIRDYTMPPYYKTGIRGNGFNDIVMVGTFGLLMHFDGFSWKSYNYLPYFSGSYVEVKIKGDVIACTGGLNDGQAIITIGRR